jgi:hypothetical protein
MCPPRAKSTTPANNSKGPVRARGGRRQSRCRAVRAHYGYRLGAGPSGTNRPMCFRDRAKNPSRRSMSGDNRSARRMRPSGRVTWTSRRSITPPPLSPGTSVPSRSTSHQHSRRCSSGTDASRRSASSSASGSSARASCRSSVATTRAAQRQNLQVPEYKSAARGRRGVASGIEPMVSAPPTRLRGLLR